MNTPGSTAIVKRFFQALHELISMRVIRGKKTFTDQYGIDRWNFNTLEKNQASDIFQVEWLKHLVDDYCVSSEWLLTGKGAVFTKPGNAIVSRRLALKDTVNKKVNRINQK